MTGPRSARFRLVSAFLLHQVRRRFRPSPLASAGDVVATYEQDHLLPLTPLERERLPAMSRCINCGLCALVVRRVGQVRLPDLASAYLRDLTLLPEAAADLGGGDPGPDALAAATAICPVGVPLDEVAAAVRRLAAPGHRSTAGHGDTAGPGISKEEAPSREG
jgi:hypothetical protein